MSSSNQILYQIKLLYFFCWIVTRKIFRIGMTKLVLLVGRLSAKKKNLSLNSLLVFETYSHTEGFNIYSNEK